MTESITDPVSLKGTDADLHYEDVKKDEMLNKSEAQPGETKEEPAAIIQDPIIIF